MTADDVQSAQERNRQAQQLMMRRMAGDDIPLDSIFTDDFIDHDPADDQPPGGEGLFAYWEGFRAGFPDMEVDEEHTAVDDEHITSVITVMGTHTGTWRGFASTGQPIRVRGVQVMRFRDGLMAERWGATDEFSILAQIGALPDRIEGDGDPDDYSG